MALAPARAAVLSVLKRLDEALADGDTIHAVIRGAAMNNDGAAKAGYTAPSVDGQVDVIATAQALADVDARSVQYVEAHGTGTPLGDPIEVAALTQVFRAASADVGFCRIGSLKANLGHLDTAAGVASLIKASLVLSNRCLPPLVNSTAPNPQLGTPPESLQRQRICRCMGAVESSAPCRRELLRHRRHECSRRAGRSSATRIEGGFEGPARASAVSPQRQRAGTDGKEPHRPSRRTSTPGSARRRDTRCKQADAPSLIDASAS